MLSPTLMLEMFALVFFLIVDGEPLRFALSHRFRIFSELDLLQICILDIYLGGMILFVVAMVPFGLFTWITVVVVTVFCFLFCISVNLKHLRGFSGEKIRTFAKKNRRILLDYTIVLTIFALFLSINFISAGDLVLGSARDESLHSLNVQVILENNQVPVTLQPYVEEGLIYPQASHVIFAYAYYILSIDVPKIILYVTILFKSLTVLGAYFLGKALGARRAYSLGLAFIFAFISNWPLSIVWGGNPFLVGFPFFLVCLGLLFSFVTTHSKRSLVELVTLGALFGYMGAIIISYLQTLLIVTLLILMYYLVRKRPSMNHSINEFALIFMVSLVPISPFVYRFIAFYQYTGHNVGIPSDFAGWTQQQFYPGQALQWALENLSPYAVLRAIMLLLVFSLPLLLWGTKKVGNTKSPFAFALAIFAAGSLLSFISFLPAALSIDFGVISWGHQGIILSISINILIVIFLVKILDTNQRAGNARILKSVASTSHTAMLLSITLISLVTIPFVYYRLAIDPESLRGGYNMFAVTTQSDYDMMAWMKSNLSSNAIVLVHPYEAGLFIPAVSHHRIIFPYTGSSLSGSYQTLVTLLEENMLNSTTYEIMQRWSITHIFISANVVYWAFGHPKFNPELMLGNPNFRLVKSIGDTYLFGLNEENTSDILFDDFEYTDWKQNGWSQKTFGTGLGNVSTVADSGSDSSKSMRIVAQATPTASEWELKYVNAVSRRIYLPSSSDVIVSFYYSATHGFGENDTFAVFISDTNSTRSIVITSANGIYSRYANALTFGETQGSFSLNLTKRWQELFNSPIPQSLTLQFVNYDFDGVGNDVYVDNVQVVCGQSA